MGIHQWSYDNDISNDVRYAVPHAQKEKTLNDLNLEVELGFDEQLAFNETMRCLNCDVQTVFTDKLCIECDACVDICPTDCITFTNNSDEQSLRGNLLAPAPNQDQDIYVSDCLETGRIMAKNEDLCLHCGLCAERCPTSAWDMQKYLFNTEGGARVPELVTTTKVNTLPKTNDFVVKFANVNGSGSASANNMFAKAIFRMGIPVSPHNIFPSNIQGLPTWYEVRVSDKNYLGRREGIDLMVAMNEQTIQSDINSVIPGGFVLYDSSKPLSEGLIREDVHYLPIPLKDICLTEFEKPSQRQLFKNIVYVGALAAFINIDFNVLTEMVSDQFRGKEKLIAPNIHALELGYQFARENFTCPLPLTLERRDLTSDKILMDGNTAIGLGCVYGGATVASWYPLTPSTSVVDAFDKYCKRLRKDPENGKNKFSVVQAEDELAAIGMAIGAGWNGARAFTASSGPGVSLMQEFLGLAYFSEVPVVLFDIQRVGPSTGMPTRTQQGDLLTCAYASHGDTKQILLFPSTPKECFEFAADSFDIADRLQNSCNRAQRPRARNE